jgi:hypothetical protein
VFCSFFPQPTNAIPNINAVKILAFDVGDVFLNPQIKTCLELKWQSIGAVITNLMSFKEMYAIHLAYIQI